MKQEVPIIIGLVFGLLVILGVFFPTLGSLGVWKKTIDDWFLLATAWAVGVGVINLTQIHAKRIRSKSKGYFHSIWLLICMYGLTVFGVFFAKTPSNSGWQFVYNQLLAPMSATVYSSIVFYIGSAAYRSFIAKSLDSTILLVSAVVVMLAAVPLGRFLLGAWINQASAWIMNVLNSSGMRGIQIGATLGAIATALRILVGIERSHVGGAAE